MLLKSLQVCIQTKSMFTFLHQIRKHLHTHCSLLGFTVIISHREVMHLFGEEPDLFCPWSLCTSTVSHSKAVLTLSYM